jgi:hypothetical protein
LKEELELHRFIDEEGNAVEFTGDVNADLVNFRKKLRRERKQAERARSAPTALLARISRAS